MGPRTLFGFENTAWKPFTLFDGTEVLVPARFNVTESGNGGWFIYPEGDTSVPPSGYMPRNGFYFDAICRQNPIDETALDPEDNLQEFGPRRATCAITCAGRSRPSRAGRRGERSRRRLRRHPSSPCGSNAQRASRRQNGMSIARRDYVYAVFENNARLRWIISTAARARRRRAGGVCDRHRFRPAVRRFIAPPLEPLPAFPQEINGFILATHWKTFIHSCGSVIELIRTSSTPASTSSTPSVFCRGHGRRP